MQTILFEDLPSTDTPIDATNLNTMQSYIEQAVNDKIGLITLLEANNVAPEQCETGDLYYNTDTTLIYEATGTDTWNTVGNAPSYDYLYLDKTNKVTYYFNGTELDVFGAAVVDDLTSRSTVNPPSIGAVNEAIDSINNNIGDIENLNTESNDLVEAINELESRKPKLLWTNPYPFQFFTPRQITLSSSDYDMLEIYYYDWVDTIGFKDLMCQKTKKGSSTKLQMQLSYSSKAYAGNRRIRYVNDTTLQVDECYTIIDSSVFNNAANQAWCVPYQIYGYKYYQEVESNES